MKEIFVYIALLISVLIGVFSGWYTAYVLAELKLDKGAPRMQAGPASHKKTRSVNQHKQDEAVSASQPDGSQNNPEQGTICLTEQLNNRKDISLTDIKYDGEKITSEELMDEYETKNNQAYKYLKKGKKQNGGSQ